MKKVKLFEEFISEANKLTLFSDMKIGDTFTMFGSTDGKNNPMILKKTGDSEAQIINKGSVKGVKVGEYQYPSPSGMYALVKGKIDESEAVMHEYDFLGMQAQAANMSREEWIAHYGSPEIGSGIDESKKSMFTVYFEDTKGEIWDWDVEASSPAEAIELVQDGKALGPYDQTLPRGARNFSAKLQK